MKQPCRTDYSSRKYATTTILTIGVKDAKGREVGFQISKCEYDVIAVEGELRKTEYGWYSEASGRAWEAEPGHYYEWSAISSRDGKRYGSARMVVSGMNDVETQSELYRRINRASKVAWKKWIKKESV